MIMGSSRAFPRHDTVNLGILDVYYYVDRGYAGGWPLVWARQIYPTTIYTRRYWELAP